MKQVERTCEGRCMRNVTSFLCLAWCWGEHCCCVQAGMQKEEATSTGATAEGPNHGGKGSEWVCGRGWCQAEGSFMDSFNTVASLNWRPQGQAVPRRHTSGGPSNGVLLRRAICNIALLPLHACKL